MPDYLDAILEDADGADDGVESAGGNGNVGSGDILYDGLLIDSEPLWRKAERIEFSKVGINLTDEMLESTVGFRIDEVVNLGYRRFQWEGMSTTEMLDNILMRMVDLISTEGEALPGVSETIDFFKQKELAVGLATSSPTVLVEAVLNRLNIGDAFHAINSLFHGGI